MNESQFVQKMRIETLHDSDGTPLKDLQTILERYFWDAYMEANDVDFWESIE